MKRGQTCNAVCLECNKDYVYIWKDRPRMCCDECVKRLMPNLYKSQKVGLQRIHGQKA